VEQDATTSGGLERASLQRIAAFFLTLTATFAATSLVLAIFLLRERQELALARGELAAIEDAQAQLLLEEAGDRAPYPHAAPGVSYVLNPALKSASFKAENHPPYPVNRLGLRGGEIRAKPAGTRRVLLVGDSLFFGWKLAEADKLATVLDGLLRRVLPDASRHVEILTVAMPGWNTLDQDAFLRNHLGRLEPDHVVWSLIRNDLFDTPGVVPPGLLASWHSPQARLPVPFQLRSPERHLDLPLPSLTARWQDNLLRIRRFSEEHDVATTLLWWREKQRPILDDLLQRTAYDGPVIHVPGRYRYDEEHWCVAAPDCHPTRWANERLAVALAEQLVRAGVVPEIAWSRDELAIARAFAEAAANRSSAGERDRFYQAVARQVPSRFSGEEVEEAAVLYGMRGGVMERNGAFVLRAPPSRRWRLQLDLQAPSPPGKRVQRVTITAPSADGTTVTAEAVLDGREPHRIVMELPADPPYGLHEIQWRFDHAECRGPTQCPAGRFISAELIDAPRETSAD
jgi:hypothetical protein